MITTFLLLYLIIGFINVLVVLIAWLTDIHSGLKSKLTIKELLLILSGIIIWPYWWIYTYKRYGW